MPIPEDIEILAPWRAIEASPEENAEAMSARLVAEIPPGHVLHGLKATAVATRLDRDDVLFQIEGAKMPLAVVHMTWRKETDPRWPRTRLFESWDQWVREEMLPAYQEYRLS
jgi:hypothetical protein